jgi:Ca2+-binding RTX toxin-like protein
MREERGSVVVFIILVLAVIGLMALCSRNADAHHGDPAGDLDGDNGPNLIVGTSHADDLRGGNGGDTIRGLGGDDRLGGEHGPDTLLGGAGDDRIWPGKGQDTIRCGAGDDRVFLRAPGGGQESYPGCEVVR